MSEQSDDPRWVAAANWAAAGGFGVGAIAQREGVTRIDALLAIIEEWRRTPDLFTRSPAAAVPVGVEQCPDCGIWFSDVDAHSLVHRGLGIRERTDSVADGARHTVGNGARPRRLRDPVPDEGPDPRLIQHASPMTEPPDDTPWRTWAEAANWAAANGLGPSRLADRVGIDAASVTVAIIDAWSHDPASFTVPGAVNVPGGALKQCPACGLWFASVDNHIAAHGRISGARRGSVRVPALWNLRADHDGHAAPRTAFERAMERAGHLDHYLELRRSVLEHLSPPQFRSRIDASQQRAAEILRRISGECGYEEAVGELLLSRPGVLFDDGDRVQCHLCGLWMAMITPHLGLHDIEAAGYRERFDLAEGDPLVSRSMHRPPTEHVGHPS
ncbi:hypothetical protein [Tsukamurella pseudospumae]|uniref:Uncharacterized protein n=1 Tax=Tsukamurella pseudospumae TaxID=239498 RepID=A0A138AVL2_9ACTN|nr:hypothetical protein [Tsukamurella pseudospumae]KXP14480.1 hypothetical protein AXK60_00785 [Tsukamurella pseudospumae]